MKKLFTFLLFAITLLTANKNYAQCDAPVNLQTSFGNNVTTFNWDLLPGTSYIGYSLQIKFSYATNWSTLASGITTNSYSYTGLFQSATFNWRVISFCSAADSAFSATQTYVVPCEAPNTPIASAITGTTATLSWTPAPTIPQLIPAFTVSYRVLGSTGPWTLVTSNTTANSVNVSGLLSNTSYEWCVNKLCSYFNSAPLIGQFTTQYVPCDIPVNLRTLSATSSQATLAWNAVNGGINYYVQYKKATATNWTTQYAPNTNITLSNLSKETLYDWRVMANCVTAYQSVYSDVKQFTTYSNPCMAYGNNVNEGIDFFSLGTISRVSGKEVGGYFKSNLSTNLLKGSANNTVTISAAYPQGIGYGDYFAVYIDYNKNGSFTDAGEQVIAPTVQLISQSSNYTATFSVPNNASLGVTKMRVILRRPGTAIVPCATGFQGEVEDYNVNIVAALARINGLEMEENPIVATNSGISPNPGFGMYTIQLNKNVTIASYTISNSNGNLIESKRNRLAGLLKIDIANQPSGIYLLQCVSTEGKSQTVKIIKN